MKSFVKFQGTRSIREPLADSAGLLPKPAERCKTPYASLSRLPANVCIPVDGQLGAGAASPGVPDLPPVETLPAHQMMTWAPCPAWTTRRGIFLPLSCD